MRLDEAEKILNQNGYELLKEDFNFTDIISYLGGIYCAWAGIKTIADLLKSSGDVSWLKYAIKQIETNKEEFVQLLYYNLLPGKKKWADDIKKQHTEIKWTLSDYDLERNNMRGIDNTTQTELNLKLQNLQLG